jgi:hypothetical protein
MEEIVINDLENRRISGVADVSYDYESINKSPLHREVHEPISRIS